MSDEPQPHHEPLDVPSQQPPRDHAIGAPRRLSVRARVLRAFGIVLALAVIAFALLPHAGITLPSGIARFLTPPPTATPRVPTFATSAWQPFPEVPAVHSQAPITPSPSDPDTAYLCVGPNVAGAGGEVPLGPLDAWATHDAGHTWQQTYVTMGQGCGIQVAPDDSATLVLTASTVLVSDADSTLTCQRTRFFLSGDGGRSWAMVPHGTLTAPGARYIGCFLWPAGGALYLLTTVIPQDGSSPMDVLQVSKDIGHTWRRALSDLPPSSRLQLTTLGSPQVFAVRSSRPVNDLNEGTAHIWMSRDDAASWQELPTLTAKLPLEIMYADDGKGVCGCILAVGNRYDAPERLDMQLWLGDGKQWKQAPPIPGQALPDGRTGLFRWLGMTADGRALALGMPPNQPALWAPAPRGPSDATPVVLMSPRVWALDLRSRTWAVASATSTMPCRDIGSCQLFPYDVSLTAAGATFWAADSAQASGPIIYRIVVPKR